MDCKYALACVTSLGVRITAENRMPTHISDRYYLQGTSAETNVLNVAASLGCPCLAMTRFVEGSPISALLKSQLRARNIDYTGPDVPQGGPWGYRHQFNIADSGYGLRAPRVWNDRAGEVGLSLRAEDFDLEKIFGRDGVQILHVSGLIAALSPDTTQCCLKVVEAARKYGTLVSFDLNYRAAFWEGREQELRSAFTRIAAQADILMGNEEDYQLCLGLQGPEAAGTQLQEKLDSFRTMITTAKQAYPNVRLFATTLRQVISANEHLWGAVMLAEDGWHMEPLRKIPVLDRMGGGDAFSGGLLYGITRGWEPEKCLKFGWAAGALVVGSLNDFAQPADEKQIWDIYAGNARIQR